MTDNIDIKVMQILESKLGVDIRDRKESLDDLGADSLDLVEIIMDIEDTFRIKIEDKLISRDMTVQDIISLVKTLS